MTIDPFRIRISRLRVTLRLTSQIQLPVYHGAALHGLVTRALDLKPFPRNLTVRCAERWSFPRAAGSLYRFGLVAIGDGRSLVQDARHRFEARGRSPHRGGEGSL